MSAIAIIYAEEIKQGVRTIEEVPKLFRSKVEEELKRREQEESAEI